MTREEALQILDTIPTIGEQVDALEMAMQALSQEPCELLIIKSDILLHQDDRKKWVESIKREKESGVIILPPYFEPLLVPTDIEINIEQKSGKWIYEEVTRYEEYYDTVRSYVDKKCKCSACGHDYGYQRMKDPFCRYCGAKMESEDKE